MPPKFDHSGGSALREVKPAWIPTGASFQPIFTVNSSACQQLAQILIQALLRLHMHVGSPV